MASATSTELDTQQSKEAAAEEAHAVMSQIRAAKRDGQDALWRLMEALAEFDKIKGWVGLGYENLSEWLADPEVSMTRTTYYRWVKTWTKLHTERKIDGERLRQLDASKASMVVDAIIEGKTPVDEVLADVEELGARDLREKYNAPKAKPEPDPANTQSGDSGHQEPEGEGHEPLTEEVASEIPADELQAIVDGEGEYSDEERQIASNEITFRAAPATEDGEAVAGEVEDPDGEGGFQSAADMAEQAETTSASAEALAQADALPWDELEKAFESKAPNPRVPRQVIEEFLSWRETHLG